MKKKDLEIIEIPIIPEVPVVPDFPNIINPNDKWLFGASEICMIEEFFKSNPNGVAMISCPCSRCRVTLC